ncbi:hypothetical protein ACFLUH_03360 [Chloroflexota bacterium]
MKKASKDHSQISVVTNWQYTEEINPGFRRLMQILLEIRGNEEKQAERESGRPDRQVP